MRVREGQEGVPDGLNIVKYAHDNLIVESVIYN